MPWHGLLELLRSKAIAWMDSCSPTSLVALEHLAKLLLSLRWGACGPMEPGCRRAMERVFARAATWLATADWELLKTRAAVHPDAPALATRVLHAWVRTLVPPPPHHVVVGLAATGAAGGPEALRPDVAAVLFANIAELADRYVNLARARPQDSPAARQSRLAAIRAAQAARAAVRGGIASRLDGVLEQAAKSLQGDSSASVRARRAQELVRLAHALARLKVCPGAGPAAALADSVPEVAPHLNVRGVVVVANLMLYWRSRGLPAEPAGMALNARCAQLGYAGPWLERGKDVAFRVWLHDFLKDSCRAAPPGRAAESAQPACSACRGRLCYLRNPPEYLTTAEDTRCFMLARVVTKGRDGLVLGLQPLFHVRQSRKGRGRPAGAHWPSQGVRWLRAAVYSAALSTTSRQQVSPCATVGRRVCRREISVHLYSVSEGSRTGTAVWCLLSVVRRAALHVDVFRA